MIKGKSKKALFLKSSIFFFFSILSMFPFICFGHGVKGEITTGGIVVNASYATGEVMSYAEVEIFAPASQIPFQVGRTDKNGRFCFFPDTQGQWKVTINDEMGHQLELFIPVNKTMEPAKLNQPTRFFWYERALMGLSIIFGVTGILLWRKSKSRNA